MRSIGERNLELGAVKVTCCVCEHLRVPLGPRLITVVRNEYVSKLTGSLVHGPTSRERLRIGRRTGAWLLAGVHHKTTACNFRPPRTLDYLACDRGVLLHGKSDAVPPFCGPLQEKHHAAVLTSISIVR